MIPLEEVDARHEICNHNGEKNKVVFMKKPQAYQYVWSVGLNQKPTMNVRFQKLHKAKHQFSMAMSTNTS
jgi:hypothetical protein